VLNFIDEKKCSHTNVLPNIAIILAAAVSNLGNLSRESVVMFAIISTIAELAFTECSLD